MSWTNPSAFAIPFSNITSGTNTGAAMVVEAGASLTYSGGTATSGVIDANQLLNGTWVVPGAIGATTPNTGAFTTLATTGNITDGGIGTGVVQANAGLLSVGAVNLATEIMGTLPVANGGTGKNGLTATGGILWDSSATAIGSTPAGTAGQILISGGAGAPSWVNASALPIPFSSITSGTNTGAAMVVGAGASLTYSGGTATSGVIDANQLLNGTWAVPGAIGATTPNTGAFTTLATTGNITDGGIGTGVVQANAGLLSVGAVNLATEIMGTLPVANGGTGKNGLTATGGILWDSSATAIGSTPAGTAGQILISGGAGAPSWVNASALPIPFSSITSGTNTGAAMVVGAGASLTYSGGTATSGVIDANQLLNGTWAVPGAIGATTPNTGAFTALFANNGLTVSAAGAAITGNSTVTGTLLTTGAHTLGNGSNTGTLVFEDANLHTATTTFIAGDQAGTNITYTLPTTAPPVNGAALTSTTAGVMSWTTSAGLSGSGAATQVAFWNSANPLTGTNNLWWDNVDTRLGIGTNAPGQALTINGNVLLSGSSNQLQLQGSSTGITTFQSGAQGATNINYTLPTTAPPVNGAALTSTTAGVMSWTTSASVIGGGAATQVAFWNSANSLTGTNNLWWDNVDTRLGIGTNTPSQPLTCERQRTDRWQRQSIAITRHRNRHHVFPIRRTRCNEY